MNKFSNSSFWPHRWLNLPGLIRLFTVLFYVPAAVFAYSAVNLIFTLLTPAERLAANSAPLKTLWFSASAQSLLMALLLGALIHGLKALHAAARAAQPK